MIKGIKQTINALTKTYKEGIKAVRETEEMLILRIDHIDCEQKSLSAALDPIAQLVECKEKEINVYDTAISKLLQITDKVEAKGITLEGEHNEKLNDLSKLVSSREQVVALHTAFETLHEVLEGHSMTNLHNLAAAEKAYSAALGRLLTLSRETWSLPLRASRPEIPQNSVWALKTRGMQVLDIKKLLDFTMRYDERARVVNEVFERDQFAGFRTFLSARLSSLEKFRTSNADGEEPDLFSFIQGIKDLSDAIDDKNYLHQTRNGIAFLKKEIVRLDIEKDISNNFQVQKRNPSRMRELACEAFGRASTVLRAQLIHLDNALHTFVLSPESTASLMQVRSNLDDLVSRHPHMLDKDDEIFIDIGKLSHEEKEQMYSELSDLPLRDDEAARHLRYLASELRTETQGGKDLDTVVGWLEEFAADLEEAAVQTESVLGELILAGVKPESYAADEAPSEHWLPHRASGLDEDAEDANPAEPSPARGSPTSAEDSSLPDASRLSLRSPQAILQKEIDAAKRDAEPIEDNIALMAKQASSNKREAEAVLTNLRKGIVEKGKTATAIYELLNLAVDRNKDRLHGLRQLIRRWEKISNPGDEVRARLAALRQDAAACEKEIRTLTDEALRKTVEGIELYPTEAGALFLHRSGLIERMEPPRWVALASYEFDHQTVEFAPVYNADGTPKMEYIHEWPIVVKRAKDSKETFMIYAHDHKKQHKEDPHPELLKDSVLVTWKNHYYVNKGKLWEQRMLAQGWSSQAAKVQRHRSGQGVLDMLTRHYLKDPQDRIPVEKTIRRFGLQ